MKSVLFGVFFNLTLILILKVLSICDTMLKNALFLGRNWQPSLNWIEEMSQWLGSLFGRSQKTTG